VIALLKIKKGIQNDSGRHQVACFKVTEKRTTLQHEQRRQMSKDSSELAA
jgi:hypothetical protein